MKARDAIRTISAAVTFDQTMSDATRQGLREALQVLAAFVDSVDAVADQI